MPAGRCVVVADCELQSVALELADLIAQRGNAAAHCCQVLPADLGDLAAIIFVTEPLGLAALAARIAALRLHAPAVAVLVAVENAVPEALHAVLAAGAFDFVSVPVDPCAFLVRLRRALGDVAVLPRATGAPAMVSNVRGLVYASDRMAEASARIAAVSRCDANVLIQGETGTGKEVCAQAVHYMSPRAARPWVAVNCGAIPVDLVETELFGHVKGAYTTALSARPGLVREAECGTLFLDDIDCLPLAAQAKLLRFLQEHEYRPVGANNVLHADVRVIAASNCDLSALAQRGAFRLDLYFRLNVLRLNLPPLRERREDIPVLALHFLHEFAREFQRPVNGLTPAALRLLFAHPWPGNVRELRHVIERAVLLASGPQLAAVDIEIDGAAPCAAVDDNDDDSFRSAKLRAVTIFERDYLERMLVAHDGNVTRAAGAAKKDRRAFFELMRKHAIRPAHYANAVPR